jgi:beta-galactosidase beta subunit
MKIQQLVDKLKALKAEVYKTEREINNCDDGFLYITCLKRYGSKRWEYHKNSISVQYLCDYYWSGEEGIVDVYTNNNDHKIKSYGTVFVLPLDELQSMSKEDVSMNQAICNWIARVNG